MLSTLTAYHISLRVIFQLLAYLLQPFQQKKLQLRLAMLVMGFGLMGGVVGQTVTTDKDDYAPGEYVIITGTGWAPGETVTFHIDETPKPATCLLSHDITAIADESGRIFSNSFLIKENHIGVSFVLTATGITSGLKAVAYFTDATWNLEVSTNGGTIYLSNSSSGTIPTVIFSACESKTIFFKITQTNNTNPNQSYSFAIPSGFVISIPATILTYNNSNNATNRNWSASQTFGTNTLCLKAATSGDALGTNHYLVFAVTITSTANTSLTQLTGRANTSNLACTDPIATSGGQLINLRPSFSSTLDNTAPVIAPVNPIVVGTDAGVCEATVVITAPAATDNCVPGTAVGTRSDAQALNAKYPKGVTTITWTYGDGVNNAVAVQQTVTVNDTEAPVLADPADVTGTNDAGFCYKVVVLTAPNATDNCGINAAGVTASGIPADNKFPVGTTIVTWSVTDIHGNTSTQTQSVTINNTSPVINSVTGPISPVSIGNSISVTIAHNDNNLVNAAFNWDDGTAVQNVVNPASGSFTVSHTYANPGVYSVFVTLTDACGLTSSTFEYQYVVIFDPNGGFVTGGGWINSPAGAYVANASLTGKANFGFVSKYKKGSNVPDGNTEFQFHAGSFNFKSSAYDFGSLVISGAKATYRGVGTVNGTGNYGFLVTATDGQVNGGGGTDKFRIKVWNKTTNVVVYDNQMNDPENADATTVIGGGSIVIHKINGNAANTRQAGTVDQIQDIPVAFNVKVFGNPTLSTFKLQLQSSNVTDKITVKVYDINGRVVELRQQLIAGQVIELGAQYKQGTYFAEVTQGDQRKVVKLIKVGNN